jgi:hybrid cluster-associated redox disulfide protein
MRTMEKMITVQPETTVKEILDNYPDVTNVFLRRKMACVGCPAEEFASLKEVAKSYEINLQELIDELAAIIDKKDY